MSNRLRMLLCGLSVAALGVPHVAWAEPSSQKQTRLVVLIVVDQLRADYLTRFSEHFGDGGFRRLARGGAHFVNAYYSYGSSATAPGHATISTGRIPRRHGIVANKWYLDPTTDRAEYAVNDDHCNILPPPPDGKGQGRSPHNLIGPSLGDQIKASDARSRVFSVALKDRAAIFLGGHNADGALWWDLRTGNFDSSTYYGAELPSYVTAFNRQKVAGRFVGRVWRRSLEEETYDGCHPTDPAWPGSSGNLGPTFPHALPAVDGEPGLAFYSALWCTPFGNELVIDMAERIVKQEQLGRGPAVDMLCIGLSSNDLCGHYFGPESAEVMDMMVRTDRQVAGLLSVLDERVGLDHCLIALTGDHGVTTMPPLAQAMRLGGGRLDLEGIRKKLDGQLRKMLGTAAEGMGARRIVSSVQLPWVYLNRSVLDGLDEAGRRRIIHEAADFLRGIDGIAEVYTAGELSGPSPSPDQVHRYLAWRCYHPERSGQLYLQLRPYWYKVDHKVAGHTSGSNHDRHVPILLYGPRIRPGRYFSPAKPSDIAVTLAAVLGIEPPLGATGSVLHEALDSRPGS